MTTNINDIMRMLPHRYPFLLIDRVLEISEDLTTCKVLKNVTANEPQFTGHFPEFPVMPGVLIIEAMAQACAVLAMSRLTEEQKKEKALFYFAGIDEARFKRVVIPETSSFLSASTSRTVPVSAGTKPLQPVDGHVAATAKMMCARRPVE